MSNVFLYCAAIGGSLLVLQFLLLLLGAGHDGELHDGSADGADFGHDQAPFLKLLSIQTVTTFATFFGLIGMTTEKAGWSPTAVALAASLAGLVALYFVTQLTRGLLRLQSQGNVDLANAIGTTGTVYLRVPCSGNGHGRVLIDVQGRRLECRAISRSTELPTGTPVRVIDRLDGDLLVVEAAA
ncbi:MAG: hypothetical protein JNN13_16945 [Planctomycetes bacterium]|nr:hypothetical protein [Planctomycetota bacterium]